jgi:cytochrome c biogenesis factor
VKAKFTKDIYVALLAVDPAKNTASFNAWDFPLVSWIWYSIPLLALGTLIALIPVRRKAGAPAPGASHA